MPAEHAYVPDMPQLMTAEELLSTNVPNRRTELVRGRLIVHEPPGGRHGYVAANLAFRLNQHIDLTVAGAVFVGDVGFTLRRDPDTVRGPDIAFVSKDRVPDPIPSAFLEFAPDLVVEILSPSDRPGEVLATRWRRFWRSLDHGVARADRPTCCVAATEAVGPCGPPLRCGTCS